MNCTFIHHSDGIFDRSANSGKEVTDSILMAAAHAELQTLHDLLVIKLVSHMKMQKMKQMKKDESTEEELNKEDDDAEEEKTTEKMKTMVNLMKQRTFVMVQKNRKNN